MNSSEGKRPPSEVLFIYSIRPLFVAELVLLLFFVPILLVFVSRADVTVSLFLLILDSIMLGSAVRQYAHRVHQALFFEDYFDVRGRNLRRSIRYEQISRVEKFSVAPIFDNRIQVRIFVSGEDPLVIPGNLRNRSQRTDLYSWLTKKVERLQQR